MRLGRSHGDQSEPSAGPDSRTYPSERGRAKVDCELGIWLPCPPVFPPNHDADSWSRLASTMWWGKSGLPHDDHAVDQLAAVFRGVREISLARIRCSQFWIYLRDPDAQPLPVYLRVLKQQGERNQRLRLLVGADDKESVRKPQSTEVTTEHLGAGLRAARYRVQDDQGTLSCIISYAFRVEEYETDVQVFTTSTDLRALTASGDDLERFIQGISVHNKETQP